MSLYLISNNLKNNYSSSYWNISLLCLTNTTFSNSNRNHMSRRNSDIVYRPRAARNRRKFAYLDKCLLSGLLNKLNSTLLAFSNHNLMHLTKVVRFPLFQLTNFKCYKFVSYIKSI